MHGIRGLVVCYQYDDLLDIVLTPNMRYLDECLVVTSTTDEKTKEVARRIPNVRLFETDSFFQDGAKFNKGRGIELALDQLGRHGWILIFDADTLFPDNMRLPDLKIGKLYNPPRLILDDPKQWTSEFNWKHAHGTVDLEFPGYFQLFHADDPCLREKPWYNPNYTHAGGADGDFQRKWQETNKIRLPFHVLHLGPRDTNWFGRVSERIDGEPIDGSLEKQQTMANFRAFKGWDAYKHGQIPEFSELIQSAKQTVFLSHL